ncbi:glycosyltransferase family 2 protein [Candidatus Pelagibacter sp. HIMB1593]|uniref:glycosyltransferase family 2 protein n=1 Tax=Candidatus Pelagibacter sp. HIMB1593 TaxID=3413355 RepID=UPI003F83406A
MKLLIVIPVFNEEKAIKKVLDEWNLEIDKYNINHKFLVINDGSTDKTRDVLKKFKKKNILVINNKNIGHGKSCMLGYSYSIKNKFTHVLQIDGDGQCDPKYFKFLFNNINKSSAIYGYRYSREDGVYRKIFTRFMEMLIFLKSLNYVKDPNSPYRLINVQLLRSIINLIPDKIQLSNVCLTLQLSKKYKITYVPINFRKRYFGQSKYNFFSMFKSLTNLIIYI